MQLEEMEKMMDANIEDRERVIKQRNDQLALVKKEKDDLEARLKSDRREHEVALESMKQAIKVRRACATSSQCMDRFVRSFLLTSRFSTPQGKELDFEAQITEYRNKLDQLEEFKSKRSVWMDSEERHRAEKQAIKDDYDKSLNRMVEVQKNNELRWAEDIRKQKLRMEEKVTLEIQSQTTAENEKMRSEHAQMCLDLKHQGVLMKSYMVSDDGPKKALHLQEQIK